MPNERGWIARLRALTAILTPVSLLLGALAIANSALGATAGYTCPEPGALPLPSREPLNDYETVLGQFLDHRCYAAPGWASDKYVRNTGPHLVYLDKGEQPAQWEGASAGTHNAVWIYYSKGVYQWMLKRERQAARAQLEALEALGHPPAAYDTPSGGAKLSPITDGAMIIKEMWAPPAQQYPPSPPSLYGADGKPNPKFKGWAVMVKDSKGAFDGWFWGYYYPGQHLDWPAGVGLPNMGFGQYCVNCHASAEDELTYSALRNVEGAPGDPVTFTTQQTPRDVTPEEEPAVSSHAERALLWEPSSKDCSKLTGDIIDCMPFQHNRIRPPLVAYAPGYREAYPDGSPPPRQTNVQAMPPAGYDHVVASPQGAEQFITADQCLGCHDAGGTGVQRSIMTVWLAGIAKLANLSPYGEWRQSPMGLAGRDPIFYAQLESERKLHPGVQGTIQNTCLQCHGAMGQHQFHIDHPKAVCTDQDQSGCFLRSMVDAVPYPVDNPQAKLSRYGALARDGIACAVCHHITIPPLKDFARTFTGNIDLGPADELYGPFKDPKPKPMEHSFKITPKASADLTKSELCGSCHTIKLPVLTGSKPVTFPDGRPKMAYEQATYLEWLFSDYRKGVYAEVPDGADPRSCQDCHMSNSYQRAGDPKAERLVSKIASIEDATNFPEADFRLPPQDIDLQPREGYARHTLVGANLFLLQMFQQFPTLLGVPTTDPMLGTSAQDGLVTASQSMFYQAANEMAGLGVSATVAHGKLTAQVTVSNRTGHKLPSGVGFRRAFLSFEVLDAKGAVLWASGRTDDQGVIVDATGKPVMGEFWQKPDCSGPDYDPGTGYPYQPHYATITRQDQAQIYQELTVAPDGYLTTSFIAIDHHLKDNRLLPRGFKTVLLDDKLVLDPQAVELAGIIGVQIKDPDELEILQDVAPFAVGEQHGSPDPDYLNGSGKDELIYVVDLKALAGKEPARIRVTLYSQSTPPFFLQDRFCTRPDGSDTRRLYFLAGHLNLAGTAAEDWKFKIVSTEAALP